MKGKSQRDRETETVREKKDEARGCARRDGKKERRAERERNKE